MFRRPARRGSNVPRAGPVQSQTPLSPGGKTIMKSPVNQRHSSNSQMSCRTTGAYRATAAHSLSLRGLPIRREAVAISNGKEVHQVRLATYERDAN